MKPFDCGKLRYWVPRERPCSGNPKTSDAHFDLGVVGQPSMNEAGKPEGDAYATRAGAEFARAPDTVGAQQGSGCRR